MARSKPVSHSEVNNGATGVFISWSGDPSKGIAEALSSLISNVFQELRSFVSSNDIEAGTNWFGRITDELARTNFGILCLTPLNLDKQWIHFEAGAIAKQIPDKASVVPFLYDVSPSDLTPPLNMFTGVLADQDGTLKLLVSLNEIRLEPFEQERLKQVFEKWWPEFAERLKTLPSIPAAAAIQPRSEHDLLEELLARVKGVQDAGPLQNPNLARTELASIRAQLAIKIADVEMKKLEAQEYKHGLWKAGAELEKELATLRQMG